LSLNTTKILEEINDYLYTGQYKTALSEVDIIIEKIGKNDKDYFKFLHLKSKILERKGLFLDSLGIVDTILNENKMNIDLVSQINFLFQKAKMFSELARFNEEYLVINQIEELLSKYDQASDELEYWLGSLHLLKGWYSINKTNFDEANNHLQNSLEIFKKRNDLENLGLTYYLMGSLFLRRGQSNQALEVYQKNLELRERIGNKYEIANALSSIAGFYANTRNISEALVYCDRCIGIIEESENPCKIGNIYNLYGLINYHKGNLNDAYGFYEKALFYLKQVGNKQQLAYILSNIGDIQKLRGNIDDALKAYLHCMEIFDEINSIQNVGAKLLDIGNIYLQKGDFKKSLSFLKKGLEYRRKTGSPIFIANSLYMLIKYYCIINNKIDAEDYLKELLEIDEKNDSLVIHQKAIIAEALVLKLDTRSRSRVNAEEKLTQIVNMNIIDVDSYFDAIINLCEILVVELKTSGNQEVLKDLNLIIEKLEEISLKQKSHWLQAEVFWIKANLALLAWDINGAQQLLTNAQIIADEKGFYHLAERISHEFDKTLNQMELWERLRETNASVAKRLEVIQLDDLLSQLKQRIIDTGKVPVETPVMFLIMKPTGEPIYKKNFLPESLQTDESLLSGFITSINMFFNEVFQSSGSIERIKHHDLTILLKPSESLLFCYIFRGQSYSAIRKVDEFISILQNENIDLWNDLVEHMKTPKTLLEKNERLLETIVNSIFY